MKKWLVVFIAVIGILIPTLWWNSLVPVSSGIYPEKHSGLVVLDVERGTKMVNYELPVRWIKSHPWERPPLLEEVILYDEDSDIVSSIKGDYMINVNPDENNWNTRNVPASIEIPINTEMVVQDNDYMSFPLNQELKSDYFLKQINITYKGKVESYAMSDTYRIVPIYNLTVDTEASWKIEGSVHVLNDLVTDGFIYHLSGPANVVLEDILFWLPGISDDYLENEVLYTFEDKMEEYWDQPDEFEGDSITFPLHVESQNLLLYFPLTDEIVNEISDSLYRSMPFLRIRDKEDLYYTGIPGVDSGLFDRGEKWENHLIHPD